MYVRDLLRLAIVTQDEASRHMNMYRKAEADWNRLGELLMGEANDRDWCSEYDRLVEEWNEGFQQFELPVRKSDYDVEVTITATYTVTIQVEAEDEDAARELVESDYSAADIMRQAGNSFAYPDDSEYEIEGVSRS